MTATRCSDHTNAHPAPLLLPASKDAGTRPAGWASAAKLRYRRHDVHQKSTPVTRGEYPLRILVVEDEALLAMNIEGALTDARHEVVGIADDFDSALARAAERVPDLALLDIHLLSGSSGLDVAAAFRTRGIPCLFVTGNCSTDPAPELALGCLHKPFDDRILVNAVTAVEAVLDGKTPRDLPSGMHLY